MHPTTCRYIKIKLKCFSPETNYVRQLVCIVIWGKIKPDQDLETASYIITFITYYYILAVYNKQ